MMSRPANNLLWFAAYLMTMAALILALVVVRGRVVANLSSPESLADWQRWKDETQQESGTTNVGPVQRIPVKSDEPPALILMRDYFAAILAVALLISSFLFGFLMIVIRGVWAGGRMPAQVDPHNATPP
jgi:hypothetical protein